MTGKNATQKMWDDMQSTESFFVSDELKNVVGDILSFEESGHEASFKFIITGGDLNIILDLLRLDQTFDAITMVGLCDRASASSIMALEPSVWSTSKIFNGASILRNINLSKRQTDISVDMSAAARSKSCTVTIVSRLAKAKQKQVL